MDKSAKNPDRRRVLRIATSALGIVGGLFAAVPFIRSMAPSARARALGSPVTIKFGDLGVGDQSVTAWRGKPVWVLRRNDEMLKVLEKTELVDRLRDPESDTETQQPEYTRNLQRSIKPETLVVVGLCTHLGCVPSFRPEAGSVDGDWLGGYYCPCHGSMFDFAGRVYKNVPAPTNLVIPPHRYLADDVVQIGIDTKTT